MKKIKYGMWWRETEGSFSKEMFPEELNDKKEACETEGKNIVVQRRQACLLQGTKILYNPDSVVLALG